MKSKKNNKTPTISAPAAKVTTTAATATAPTGARVESASTNPARPAATNSAASASKAAPTVSSTQAGGSTALMKPTTPHIQNSAANAQGARPTRPNRVLLELEQPNAKSVYVAGSFNGWKADQTPLLPAGNGRWVADLKVGPGRHEYLFVVDGKWLPDPKAPEAVQNPFGGTNSVMVVSQ